MADALAYLCAALTFFGATVKVHSAGATAMTTARKYLVVGMAADAATLAVGARPTLQLARHIEPIPNATSLLANALAMFSTFCLLGVLNHSIARRRARTRVTVFGTAFVVCVVAMTVLLTEAGFTSAATFTAEASRDPRIVAYLTIYLAYMACGLVCLVWTMGRFDDVAELPPIMLRTFRSVQFGGSIGVVWVAWKATGLVLLVSVGHALPRQAMISDALAFLAITIGGVGATYSGWWPALREWPSRWQVRRADRQLEPLWAMVTGAVPHVQLGDQDNEPRLPRADRAQYRLYRRTVEIRDGQLALRPYIPPDTRAWALAAGQERGLDPVSMDVLIEAAELAGALKAHRAGRRQSDVADVVLPSNAPAAPHLLAEARWLIRIGAALRHDADLQVLRG